MLNFGIVARGTYLDIVSSMASLVEISAVLAVATDILHI